MLKLSESISDWQQHLASDSAMTADEISELTAHVIDQCRFLQDAGLSEEEAIIIAARRIGRPYELSDEFSKLNPLTRWRTRLLWMVGGYLLCTFVSSSIIKPLALLTAVSFSELGMPLALGDALSYLVASALIALVLAALIPILRRWGARLPNQVSSRRPSLKWLFVWMLVLINLTPVVNAFVTLLLVDKGFMHIHTQTHPFSYTSTHLLPLLVAPLLLLILAMAVARRPRQSA